MLLDKICKELGVEVGDSWLGNTGKNYIINEYGKVRVWNDEYDEWIESYYDLGHIVTGELKPVWKPKKGDIVWVTSLEEADKVVRREWLYYSSKYDERAFNRGLVFKTKEEAEEMANKILEFVKEEK